MAKLLGGPIAFPENSPLKLITLSRLFRFSPWACRLTLIRRRQRRMDRYSVRGNSKIRLPDLNSIDAVWQSLRVQCAVTRCVQHSVVVASLARQTNSSFYADSRRIYHRQAQFSQIALGIQARGANTEERCEHFHPVAISLCAWMPTLKFANDLAATRNRCSSFMPLGTRRRGTLRVSHE